MPELEQPNGIDEVFNDDMSETEIMDAFANQQSDTLQDEVFEEPTEPVVEEPVSEEPVATEPTPDAGEPAEQDVESNSIIDFTNPFIVKNRGINLPVNNPEEAKALMEKGLDYTRKTQELSNVRKEIDYMSAHNISMADLQTLAEARGGSKTAVSKIAKDAAVDPYELDSEATYSPDEKFNPVEATEADQVAADIVSDPQLASDFQEMLSYVPDSFKETLRGNADTLRRFGKDVKNGIAKEVLPEALKLNAIAGGGDFTQHYINAVQNVYGQNTQQEAPTQTEAAPAPTAKPVSPNRAKATVTTPSGTDKTSATSMWDMDDESFMDRIKEMSEPSGY